MAKFKLFLIDPQVAFTKAGEPLCVPGAPEDATRIAALIRDNYESIEDIIYTIDTHPVNHIGHPGYWIKRDGSVPAPFTFITPDMIQSGEILPADASKVDYAKEYITTLNGAMIWPEHCVPGTESHRLNDEIESAINYWNVQPTAVKKGFHLDLESFGIFEPEFLQHEDRTADFNTALVGDLLFGDLPIVVAGEALSHCVRRSVEQLTKWLKEYKPGFDFSRIIILKDCMSSVPSFEAVGTQFLADMEAIGCRVVIMDDIKHGRVF